MSDGRTSANTTRARARSRRWLALAARVVLIVLLLAGVAAFAAWRVARASLPLLDGTRPLPGLSADVVVERDGLGIPTVTGRTREDVARATGFLHAQDRFFQMDLARRFASGELAALVGKAALPVDRALRLHRFRAVARQAVARLNGQERRLLDAYVSGVNEGLSALDARPVEYLLLRAHPDPWRAEDALLVVAYMYYGLQQGAVMRESLVGIMRETLPPSLVAFLMPRPDEWEAPIAGTPPPSPPMPTADEVNLRASAGDPSPSSRRLSLASLDDEALAGSNSWAVDAAHAAAGYASLANDMHLDTSVPNIWYRMTLRWPESAAPGGTRRVTGVTLPGVPAVVVGSNGQVAWGFTNAMIESSDLVVLEPAPAPAARGAYQAPSGPAVPVVHEERIACKGAGDEVLRVEETVWGPVVDIDHRGRRRALAWVAQRPDAFNLVLMRLESAGAVAQTLDIGAGAGMPAQNLVVADAQGHIGWTIAGAVPNRVGFDGTFPVSWADGSRRWDGLLPASAHPRLVDPPTGRIWTANNQVVFGLSPEVYSPLSVDEGARAQQIRDRLLALPAATERDLLQIQLDDRAIFAERWRTLLLRTLSPEGAVSTPDRRQFQRLAASTWTGRASADSVAYTLVTRWRRAVADEVFHGLTLPCRAASPTFDWLRPARGPVPLPPFPTRIEAPLWQLVTERPLHLLPPRFRNWDELLLAAVDVVILDARESGQALADLRWGTVNSRIRHPLSGGVGPLAPWFDMEDLPLDGGANVPRQRVGTLTASERLVVAPGHEDGALFHMPGGQSGHPLSAHYRDGHVAWVRGDPTPFLPGKAVHRLVLTAAR